MIIDQINQDLTTSVKAQDQVVTSTLRMMLSNIKNAQIAKGSELTDEEVQAEITRDAKRHKESIAAFEKAGRIELVEKEKAELAVLSKYLPQEYSQEELTRMVTEAIAAVGAKSAADVGRVVGAVMSSAGPRADGAKVSEIVRTILAADSQ